jgi:hypothetical protein
MPNCESNNVLMSNTYKKIAKMLLTLFTEFNSQNESLVTTLTQYSSDINGNKEGLIQALDNYIIYRSDCCYNMILRLNEIIDLFEQIRCVEPIENIPTTTVEATTTIEATTTLDDTICNFPTLINEKGVYYPYTIDKFLGTATGLVAFSFDAYDIPNRFVVEFDGNTMIDTGYVGSVLFQSYLDALVYLEGDVAGDISPFGSGLLYFLKDTATDHATVSVYSPFQNSRFQFTITCPDSDVECMDIAIDILEIEIEATTTTDVTTTSEVTTTLVDCELDGIIECDITTTEEPTTTIL